MRPAWIALVVCAGWVIVAALRGAVTRPGTWIGAITVLVVAHVVFTFLDGKSDDDGEVESRTRRERLHAFTARHPWRAGFAGAAAIFGLWMALGPLFDRAYSPAHWQLAFGTSAMVFVVYVCAGYSYRKQQRGTTGSLPPK